MKKKWLNFLLILTSLMGYLEWGGGSRLFLYQAEGEVLGKFFTEPNSVIHPFTLLPMAGQILLMITLFQKKPSKLLTYLGIGSLGLLLGFMCFIGLWSHNLRITLSTLPYIFIAVITIWAHQKVPTH